MQGCIWHDARELQLRRCRLDSSRAAHVHEENICLPCSVNPARIRKDDASYKNGIPAKYGESVQISVEELTREPDKYLAMLAKRDIFIAQNGKQVARLTRIKQSKEGLAAKLFGILPKNADLEGVKDERLSGI